MSRDERDQRLREALRLLAEEAGITLDEHPWGHLLPHRNDRLELRLELPLDGKPEGLRRAAKAAAGGIADGVRSLLTHQATFRPGRVFCLRCASCDCEHAAPGSCREVFAGYGPSGLPRFAEFGQFLLQRGDPRVDQLYLQPPRCLAHTSRAAQLSGRLLPFFRDLEGGFRIHGQVAAGWFAGRDADHRPAAVAVSFQVISTQPRNARRSYALNVVGVGPGGESLGEFCDRAGAVPWASAVRWAQGVLDQIASAGRRSEAKKGGSIQHRLQGLLSGLARRLEKDRRAHGRRTHHAGQRHESGERPTRMAMADLQRSGADTVFEDRRRKTWVVLGDRGRAHVFNQQGKLVTSIRYSSEAIDKRRKSGTWRPARSTDVEELKRRVLPQPTGPERAGAPTSQ